MKSAPRFWPFFAKKGQAPKNFCELSLMFLKTLKPGGGALEGDEQAIADMGDAIDDDGGDQRGDQDIFNGGDGPAVSLQPLQLNP